MTEVNLTSNSGFTLIELVVVILIVGILAISTIPNWQPMTFSLEYEARRIRDDLRYTQALSVTTGSRYRWVRLSANSYHVLNEAGTAIILPSGNSTLTLSTGINFGSFTNLPNNLVAFNSQGAPYINSTLPGTALASTASIVISNGSRTRTVQVSPQTGYVGLS